MKNTLLVFLGVATLVACAAAPQIVVDPQSISDVPKYNADMAECKAISEGYDASGATGGSAVLGGAVALGTVAAILATGGMYLLVPGIAAATGGGAAIGSGIGASKENGAKERIWADCMTGRGFKAYTSR